MQIKRNLKVKFLLFLLLALIFFTKEASLAQENSKIEKFTLNNGLDVVLTENHSSKVTAFEMWVRVGSRYESDKEAGLSHVFEHMLFKGTKKRGVGQIAKDVEKAGGEINAFTSFDHTVYYLTLASRDFDTGLDIISDAIMNSSFDPNELKKEIQVILEEIKMGQDDPSRRIYYKLFENAYEVHPYGRPVIGYDKNVKSFTREDILAFFHKWYVPNNMTLIVSGDFDSKQAKEKIKEIFKDFKRKELPKVSILQEPSQKKFKSVIVKDSFKESYVELGYHIPSITDSDTFAIDVLSTILGNGDSSRLYQGVREKRGLVYSIQSYAMTIKDAGMFLISATLGDKDPLEAIKGILDEIRAISTSGVTSAELEKAKLNIESDFVFSKESVEGEARKIGYFESYFSNYNAQKDYIKGIKEVTGEDVIKAVKKYFTAENLTAALLQPNGNNLISPEKIKEIVLKESEKESEKKKNEKKEIKTKLSNGMTVVVKTLKNVPTVAVNISFTGGVRAESRENNGIFNLISSMLIKGTAKKSSYQLAVEIESIAAMLDGFSGKNSFGVNGAALSRYFDRLIDLAGEIIIEPSFLPDELKKVKGDVLSSLRQIEDNLPRFTFRNFAKMLFPNHPYGMDMLGTKSTIEKISSAEIKAVYKKYAVPSNAVITVVGDVNADHALKKVKEVFENMPDVKLDFTPPAKEAGKKRTAKKEIHKEKMQSHIVIGFIGSTMFSEDRYPLEVLNSVLSGQGGRLFLELRDKKSLGYAVTSFNQLGVDEGMLGFYIGTSPEKKNDAINGILAELKKIYDKGITLEELANAKKNIIGTYEISQQKNSAKASSMALSELYGLGYKFSEIYPEKIDNVTLDDIKRVIKKYIKLDAYTMVIVGAK